MINKCICIHCLKDVTNPRFLIPANFGELNVNEFDCSPDIIGLDSDKTDSILKAKLNNYEIKPENEEEKDTRLRLSCDSTEKILTLKNNFRIIVKSVEEIQKEYPNSADMLEHAATIDGKALFVYQPLGSMVATELICDTCHLILSSKKIVREHNGAESFWKSVDESYKSNFTVSLIAGSKSGKTNLLLAMQDCKNKNSLKLMMNEPFIKNHFQRTREALLEEGKVPDTTGSSQPPITFRTEQKKDVNILDTMGEEIRMIHIGHAVWTDMLVILLDIDAVYEENSTDTLRQLRRYLSALEDHFQTRNETKPIILCFTKCDLYPKSANNIMLYPLENNFQNYDPAKLRVIRNYQFMENTEKVICKLCEELNSIQKRTKDNQLYLSVYQIIQDIIRHCNEISGQKIDIMCIAPLGTPAKNGQIDVNHYHPQHVDDLLHRIVQYAGEAES